MKRCDRHLLAGVVVAAWLSVGARGQAGEPTAPLGGGFAATRGGTDGALLRVTNLRADGPGSLRAAIQTRGPRLIVFEVGGVIDLQQKNLVITEPHITVAGQTAPSPGLTIIKGGISIRTHDVIVQHIRVRPGDAGQPKRSGWEVDAISTSGADAHNILVDHCSLTWATDENLSVSGPRLEGPEATSRRVTFRHNIIAECLHDSTHPKGRHSMGSLIHDFCRDIAIIGNLYAHNNERNPYFKAHTTGVIVNNLIYNPGSRAIQLGFSAGEWTGSRFTPVNPRVSIVGNVMFHGPDTRRALPLVTRPGEVYLEDNLAFDATGQPVRIHDDAVTLLDEKPVWPAGLRPLPADQVVEHILANVGARPWDRDETDRRIIGAFRQRAGRIINSQQQVGGYPQHRPVRRALPPPATGRQQWLDSFGGAPAPPGTHPDRSGAPTPRHDTMRPPMRDPDRIRPWPHNPRYWQYKGQPVMLLGGSREDNLFQIPDLEPHLELLASVGGNLIRNTMSDRDRGDAYPLLRLADGRYDLEQWDPEYWRRFDAMLRLTHERDIIVQIEVWDRFDLSDAKGMNNWQRHPYNPRNNVTWTYEQTGFAVSYPDHPARDRHPFYHTVPGMPGYDPRLDIVRRFQERFVDRLLQSTLPYPHVLYCINNETSTDPRWGQYWMAWIKRRAAAAGVEAFVTDMFDDVWQPEKSAALALAISRPDLYDFLDVSQVNSRNFGRAHWDRFQWIRQQTAANPRPLNHTKIYSAGNTGWGSGTPQEGVARFWRNILGGAASSRFHRPSSGIGLNELAQACLRAARQLEREVRFWDLTVAMDRLQTDHPDRAYAAATTRGHTVVFFPDGGSARLAPVTGTTGRVRVRWLRIAGGDWSGPAADHDLSAALLCPGAGEAWVALLTGETP
jgi:hypothetical protein